MVISCYPQFCVLDFASIISELLNKMEPRLNLFFVLTHNRLWAQWDSGIIPHNMEDKQADFN